MLVPYDVPGPSLWHERLVLDHLEGEDYAVITPDREVFLETLSLGNEDLRGLRILAPGGAVPVGLRAGSIYRLPVFIAAEIANYKAEAGQVVAAERGQRGQGLIAAVRPVVPAKNAAAPAAVAGALPAIDADTLYWFAAESAGEYKYGDTVVGVAVAVADGAKAVHPTANGGQLFIACLRGRDLDAFLRRPQWPRPLMVQVRPSRR